MEVLRHIIRGGIAVGRRTFYKWTDEQERFLIKQHGKMTVKGIAVALGMKEKQVISKVQSLERQKLITRKKNASTINQTIFKNEKITLTKDELFKFQLTIGNKYRILQRVKGRCELYITGEVIDITDRLIIIKTKHYTTSIMKVDIINREYIGEAI